jgi:hypothetical protein
VIDGNSFLLFYFFLYNKKNLGEIYNYERVVFMRIIPLVGLMTIVINLTITLLGLGIIVITMTTCMILGIYVTTFTASYLFYTNHLHKIAIKYLV